MSEDRCEIHDVPLLSNDFFSFCVICGEEEDERQDSAQFVSNAPKEEA